MRQIFYVSDSLVPADIRVLDQLMVQARTNNAIDGITGLLWTDGRRFAQVIEGGKDAIADLLSRLEADPRHTNIQIADDSTIFTRQFGDWSMMMPAVDALAEEYEVRLRRKLSDLSGPARMIFEDVVARSIPPLAA